MRNNIKNRFLILNQFLIEKSSFKKKIELTETKKEKKKEKKMSFL